MKRNQIRRWLWGAVVLFLAAGGCVSDSGGKPLPEQRRLSGEQVRELAEKNLLEVRVDEHLQSLAREHAHQDLLLAVPGRFRERQSDGKEAAGSARRALELALAYQHQLLAPGEDTGAELARTRCRRLLALECDEVAAGVESLERQRAILKDGRGDPGFAGELERETAVVDQALAEKYMELRTLVGLPPGTELKLAPSSELLIAVPESEQLEVALSLRPEFAGAPVSSGELAAGARSLAERLPPESGDPVRLGWRSVEMLLRLPRYLAERSLAERRTAPVTRHVGAALALDRQLALDRMEVARCRREMELAAPGPERDTAARLRRERAALSLRLAELRLAADLGLPPGVGRAAAPPPGKVSPETEQAVELLLQMGQR